MFTPHPVHEMVDCNGAVRVDLQCCQDTSLPDVTEVNKVTVVDGLNGPQHPKFHGLLPP
jgi:hypothetical protein